MMKTDTMHTVCCQIQIDRLPTLTEEGVIRACRRLSESRPSVRFESGEDNGRYINLFIESDDAVAACDLINTALLSDRTIGHEIRTAAIVTMTGRRGWDDYLLLHHFDPIEPLDSIEGTG